MVYTLILKLLPLRVIFGVVALVIGTQMMGVDLVTPALDWVLNQVDTSLGSLWEYSGSLW